MTLAQWCRSADVKPTHPTTERGAVSLCLNIGCVDAELADEIRHDLWHLSDYCVSSVSGPVVWLVPREKDGAA